MVTVTLLLLLTLSPAKASGDLAPGALPQKELGPPPAPTSQLLRTEATSRSQAPNDAAQPDPAGRAPQPAPGAGAGDDPFPLADSLLLEVSTDKPQLYLHQPIQIAVQLNTGSAMVRNLQYPRLNGTAFALTEFGPPVKRSLARDGRESTVYLFTATLTPKKAGRLLLGPAEISCELLVPAAGPAGFFATTESRKVRVASRPVPLTVLPLPEAGRPAAFGGAVGRFTVTREVEPRQVEAGEPLTVRTVVRGTGALAPDSCSSVTLPGWRSYPPRVERSAGILKCEQVVVPESPGLRAIPEARVPFFDPEQGRYGTARSGPVPIEVRAGRGAASSGPPREPVPTPASPEPAAALPGERALHAPAAAPPLGSPVFPFLALLVAGALLLAAVGMGARRSRFASVAVRPPPLEKVQHWLDNAEAALAQGDVEEFYTALFRTLQHTLGERLDLAPVNITAPLPGGLPAGLCQATCGLLHQCDRVRYGRHTPQLLEMTKDLELVREIVATCRPADSTPLPAS